MKKQGLLATVLFIITIGLIGTYLALDATPVKAETEKESAMTSKTVYDFTANTIDGEPKRLSDYRGKVLLIVNVASKCGFTPQYEGLQALYEKYHDQGFEILGFPCNQFMNQEPGTAKEIKSFCKLNYGVTFPLFEKIDVNGNDTHPLYKYLKESQAGLLGSGTIKWNFTKFLVDRRGRAVKRFAPSDKPEGLAKDIEALLADPA